jgi:serine protease Do/serine protease DegQ
MRFRLRSLLLLAALAALAIPAGAAVPIPTDGRGQPTLAPMLAQVTPAVVNIAVLVRQPEMNPMMRDPFFRRFFELPDQPSRPQVSAGSGVVIDAAQGLVVTNHHVIKDAQEVVVTLKDRRQFPAKLIGSDPGTDIALLRIPAEKLAAVPIGDSDALQVGDYVVAIGNPFGIGQTVTSGIVSALGRSGLSMEGYEDFIQTDASINPGNSGGALVNLKGELVGINSAIIAPTGANVGIGFAVPSNMARAVVEQIQRYGEVRRGRMGVAAQDLTPDLAKSFGLAQTEGAVVTAVEPDAPADRAGLRVRDVVVAVNGRAVRGSADMRNRIGLIPVGEPFELRVLREGKPVTLRGRVGELHAVSTSLSGAEAPQLAGAKVANIEAGMPMFGKVQGAIVTAVDPQSAAYRNGIRAGDIMLGVNRTRVRNAPEFIAALRSAETPLRLTLLRGDVQIVLIVR